ncbi:MAG: hypothetical protein HC794_04215 [Nitrospiraceae bacterium]|nr:hypothetical protein [Nitrospiraceae bacterium]
MRARVVDLVVCPKCRGQLEVRPEIVDGDEPPATVNDGMGEGVFRLPFLGGRFSLLLGAPAATAQGSHRPAWSPCSPPSPGKE